MLTTLGKIFYLEFILLLRYSREWLYALAFFLIIICLFPLAFTPDTNFLRHYIPGCIWIAALLASLLSIEQVFFTDLEDGNLDQLLLSQIPPSLLVLAKLLAQWLVTELPLILITPIIGFVFQMSTHEIRVLCLGLLLGTPILTLIGSFGVALTLGLRQQGMLIGLLIFPLVTPVLIFGVNMVQQAQDGLPYKGPLLFLAGMFILAISTLPFAIAATLRVSSDD